MSAFTSMLSRTPKLKPVDFKPEYRDTGMRCLVAHYEDNEIQAACIRCYCGQWIRPEDWAKHAGIDTGP